MQLLETSQNHELVATIPGAAVFLSARRAGRTLLTVSGDAESRSVDAAVSEIALRDCRATLAGPAVGASHSCVIDFQGLSFSILFSATR